MWKNIPWSQFTDCNRQPSIPITNRTATLIWNRCDTALVGPLLRSSIFIPFNLFTPNDLHFCVVYRFGAFVDDVVTLVSLHLTLTSDTFTRTIRIDHFVVRLQYYVDDDEHTILIDSAHHQQIRLLLLASKGRRFASVLANFGTRV